MNLQPDKVTEVVAGLEVAAVPVEMKAPCQMEVCYQTGTWAVNGASEVHQNGAGNLDFALFVSEADERKQASKVVWVVKAAGVGVADWECHLSVTIVATQSQWKLGVEVGECVKQNDVEVELC